MRSLALLSVLSVACVEREATPEPLPSDAAPAAGDASSAGDPGDVTALLPGGDIAAMPAAASVQLPRAWQGKGVLANRGDKPPRGAPMWARVLAEVVEKDGRRYLQTTGRAERIKNTALARTTAESRARAEMTRWVASERLIGSEITDVWQHPKSGITFARVAIAVPETWVPGSRIPAEEPAKTP